MPLPRLSEVVRVRRASQTVVGGRKKKKQHHQCAWSTRKDVSNRYGSISAAWLQSCVILPFTNTSTCRDPRVFHTNARTGRVCFSPSRGKKVCCEKKTSGVWAQLSWDLRARQQPTLPLRPSGELLPTHVLHQCTTGSLGRCSAQPSRGFRSRLCVARLTLESTSQHARS